MIRILAALSCTALTAVAAAPLGCAGSATLATFRLSVRPFSQGEPLPLRSVAEIPGGSRLVWSPQHLTLPISKNAEVAAVLVPADGSDLITLDPRKASVRSEWQLPERAQVIGLIFGPDGLDDGKIQSLVTHNPELLRELALYAEQSTQVESLMQELAKAEQSGSGPDSVLKGFSAQYGGTAPRLDPKASSNQQAAVLLKALVPASNAYDPLAATAAQAQQSGGLAASIAGMFFGNPVALAAGGAALFQNLRTAMFPGTDFRSAFAQASDQNELTLCTKNSAAKSRMRSAYLWAYRVPEVKKPAISLVGEPHLPVRSKSTVAIKLGQGFAAKDLGMAREWRLTPVSGGASTAVVLKTESSDSVEIDLSKPDLPAGDYHLAATWDWDQLPVNGTLHLHPYSDYARVIPVPADRDKLVEGSGSVPVKLSGADFEFLDKVSLESSAAGAKAEEAGFSLPVGKRRGPQNWVTVNVDTAKRGSYRLLLAQSDGAAHAVPVTVLPPNPKISNLPIRLNVAETREVIHLQGSGMDRVESASSDAGSITGMADSNGWLGDVDLKSGLSKGERYALVLKVQGLENPVIVPNAIEMVGPRPKIRAVQKSLSKALGIAIGADELPSGTAAGFVLMVDNVYDHKQTKLELGCEPGFLRQSLTLSPSESSSGPVSLTFSGPRTLYLSMDPGTVGYDGCHLSAIAIVDPEGRSDSFTLGRVIRIPRLDKFTLSTEKIGDSSYAGTVEGRDLDVVEKIGWDAMNGVPVESIPTPSATDSTQQTLRVVLPWPAPGPHAPLYVWLRGETVGRLTSVTY